MTKTETTILTEAAGREGLLALPEIFKEVTRQRLLGKLLKDGLIAAVETDGAAEHRLTPAGYRAVGLEAPRTGSKKALVAELLGRPEGASLAELIAATGWLPHTTRAALSRLRSAGKPLAKATREDGTTAYRLVPETPVVARKGRKPVVETAMAAA